MKDISVIVPICRRYLEIDKKVARLADYLSSKKCVFEIILIDNRRDGIDKPILAKERPDVRTIRPSSEEGRSQSNSYICGFEAAEGDWSVIMDEDHLGDRNAIDRIMVSLDDNYDAIRTYRIRRGYDSPLRYLGSKGVNFFFNFGNRKKLKDIGSSLSAYKKKYYKKAIDKKFEHLHAFLPFLIVLFPSKVKEVPIDMNYKHKRSEYRLRDLLMLFGKILRIKLRFGRRGT